MPKITKPCVDQIYDRLDILDVLNDFVSLKKKGQNHWACCPFHNEKSASFSVSEAKQIYKCFGCGAAGNAVGFVMAIQKISYPEALKYLANKYNISLEYENTQTDEDQEAQTQRESVLIAMDFAKKHFKNLLKTHPEGISVGQAYIKERGFSPQTVDAFELGYSLPLWDNFLQTAQKEQFKTEILEQSGLILKNEQGKTYDRFRGRVMFPILDLAGKTIAFGARSLKKDEQPKYLNSPETPVYTKGEMLYGLYQARNEIRKKDNCYLTEGYTDVISMYQAGIQNVVASLGTSLTEKQIRLIKRFTENVTVLYDGDSSGIKASIRGIDMLLSEGLNVKIVLFPEGEDPDSYCQKLDSIDFQKFLETNSQDFITFKTNLFLQKSQNDPIKKAEAIKEILQSIGKIPDPIKRSVFYQQCSELLGIPVDSLSEKPKPKSPMPTPAVRKTPVFINEQEQNLSPQEAKTLKMIAEYGREMLTPDISLSAYIANEISDMPHRYWFGLLIETILRETQANSAFLQQKCLEIGANEILQKLIDWEFSQKKPSSFWGTVEPVKDFADMAFKQCLFYKREVIQRKIAQRSEMTEYKTEERLIESVNLGRMLREINAILQE